MLETQVINCNQKNINNQALPPLRPDMSDILNITKNIFAEYHDDFIYIDPKNMIFHDNEIKGIFKFTGAAYMKPYSKILNNAEAMFIFNQIQYLLITGVFLQEGQINTTDLKNAYSKLDGIVYKNMSFNFKRSITEADELSYFCKASKFFDHKDRPCFKVELNLANGAFEITGTAVCLSKSIHIEGV